MFIQMLFFLFFVCIPSGILGLLWIVTRNNTYIKALGLILAIVGGLIALLATISFFTSKSNPNKADIYGEYVIDRTKFPGREADWQYNHFRFEITKDNRFVFHQTENENVVKTWQGSVEFLPDYKLPRIILTVDSPQHHIIEDCPTLYRTTWSFYYVFHSPKFGNVFFRKEKWKPI
jgi:hypothetical protein